MNRILAHFNEDNFNVIINNKNYIITHAFYLFIKVSDNILTSLNDAQIEYVISYISSHDISNLNLRLKLDEEALMYIKELPVTKCFKNMLFTENIRQRRQVGEDILGEDAIEFLKLYLNQNHPIYIPNNFNIDVSNQSIDFFRSYIQNPFYGNLQTSLEQKFNDVTLKYTALRNVFTSNKPINMTIYDIGKNKIIYRQGKSIEYVFNENNMVYFTATLTDYEINESNCVINYLNNQMITIKLKNKNYRIKYFFLMLSDLYSNLRFDYDDEAIEDPFSNFTHEQADMFVKYINEFTIQHGEIVIPHIEKYPTLKRDITYFAFMKEIEAKIINQYHKERTRKIIME